MPKILLASNESLDNYVLNYELSKFAGISTTAYKFWKNTISAHFNNSRAVFLLKSSVPQKYQNFIPLCSDLSGLVLANAFCSFCGLANSHLVSSNCSKLNEILQIHKIANFKFVNIKVFYERFNLPKDAKIYIEKCKYFSPTPLERRIKLTDTLCLGYY